MQSLPPEVQIWLALLGPAVIVGASVVSAIWALWRTIAGRFQTMDEKIDEQTNELKSQMEKFKDDVTELYRDHEKQDQERHTENVRRFATLETIVKGYQSPWPGMSH